MINVTECSLRSLVPAGAVLNEVGGFSIAADMLGILVTGIYVVGIIERRDARISGVGVDTILAAGTYLGGLALLFTMR